MPRPLPPWLELIPAANTDTAGNITTSTPTSHTEPSQTDNLLPWDTMSSTSTPISPQMFALAVKDLPVDTLYAKAAELLNSVQHLRDSNLQMREFADEGDEVCKEAIAENEVVMGRMQERVDLCKVEVERRGMRWTGHVQEVGEEGQKTNGEVAVNGNGQTETEARPSGRLTDEELRRQLEAQMDGDDDEDGVHL